SGLAALARRFRHPLELPGATLEEAPHVGGQHDPIDERAEGAERAAERECVLHERVSRPHVELVQMAQLGERATHLDILEHPRPVKSSDPRGETLRDAEVPSLPGHLVTKTEKAAGSRPDRAFAGVAGRSQVSIDVARQVET